jgi:hypothetical protein
MVGITVPVPPSPLFKVKDHPDPFWTPEFRSIKFPIPKVGIPTGKVWNATFGAVPNILPPKMVEPDLAQDISETSSALRMAGDPTAENNAAPQ